MGGSDMNKSFHYHCIRVLAEKAGFSEEHAQTIAYASQYTDDATEHGKMTIRNIPSSYDYPRWDESKNTFDPICTAHSAKSWLKRLWKWAKFYLKPDVQRKILMPFHFLPPEELSTDNKDRFIFVTQKDSVLANTVVDNALKSISESTDETFTHSLIKLGIALHTYADTWSHDGFSGRHSSEENDIKRIKIKEGAKFKAVNPLEQLVSYAAPDVGHAEAGTLPDESDNHWKAKYANKKGRLGRDNPQEFLNAAEEIYNRLISVSENPSIGWEQVSAQIDQCLKNEGAWENTFQDIKFDYSRFTWRAAALSGDTVDWDDFDDETDFHKLDFEYTGNDMRWLLFHKAAYEQRRLISEKIPKSWMST
jgi:hypothetical protein